jgi:cytochrome c oxidase cbb3-type subunit 2
MKFFKLLTLTAIAICLTIILGIPLLKAEEAMKIKAAEYDDRPPVNETTIAEGKAIFDRSCVLCHGPMGQGDGPAAFFLKRDLGPRPRDFTRGVFKFRSTLTGELPLDEDLFRTVTNGVVGLMPPFAGFNPADRWKIIYYVKTFFDGFEGADPKVAPIKGYPIPASGQSVKKGYEMYQKFGCQECHGGGGKGNGTSAPELTDDRGDRLPPANLTMPNSFKNGHRPEDIYRTMYTGLNGTPMPSYASFVKGKEDDLWHIANYILSLSERRN